MCQDQTAIQNDYVERRDICRQYSELKLDMAMRNSGQYNNEQNRKAMLITLFSHCMSQNGWNTTDVVAMPLPFAAGGAAGAAAGAAGAAGTAGAAGAGAKQAAATSAAITAAEQRASISRTAECAFARQSASVSSIAAARAKACDLECAQRLRLAPEAPRPAACPSGAVPGMEPGVERTY